MNVRDEISKSSRFWFCFSAALLVVAAAFFMVQPFQAAAGDSVVVTNSQGILHVSIPYRAHQAGDGNLTIEVLDPEDVVVGRVEQRETVEAGPGRWQEDIKLPRPMASEDLVWHRLRYRFAYASGQGAAIEGTDSISEILRTPVVHILGQQSYLTGGPAAVRIIATDSKNQPIAGPGSLRIEMTPNGQTARALYTGRLNARGTADAEFRF